MIAALYIDAKGPYPRMAAGETFRVLGPHGEPYCRDWGPPREVDCWDAERDARLYAGPYPVVAHPPCKHWGRLRHLAKDTKCDDCHGTGQHPYERKLYDCASCNGRGWLTDKDCAPRAVEQVRAFGGVLEHPARSKLWEACGLPPPRGIKRKRPLYWVAWDGDQPIDEHGGYTIEVDQCEWGHVARKRTWLYLVGVPREALETPPFPGREPTHHVSRDANRAKRNGYTLKRTGSKQNLLTPPLFAEYLVRLARAAGQERSRYLAEKRAVEGCR